MSHPSTGLVVGNVVAFNAGWWACILGAANGLPWLGVGVVAASAAWHLYHGQRWRQAALVYTAALLIGVAMESLLAALGLYRFSGGFSIAWLCPPWLAAMWVNMATALDYCLRWLSGRYGLSALLAALSAAPAYYGGAALGAIDVTAPLWLALGGITLVYIVSFPLLVWLNDRTA